MRQFFCSIVLLTGIWLAATEAAAISPWVLEGTLAAALEIPSAPVRQGALLKLLAASVGEAPQNVLIYCLLETEFEEKAPDETVQKQLAQLYKEHPADLMIVSLYAAYGEVKDKGALLEKALTEIVPPPPQDKRFSYYLLLVREAMECITAEGDPLDNAWQEKLFERRLALLDRVIAKQQTEQFALTSLRLDLLRKALYYCDDLELNQKQFEELPSSHFRKKLYLETLAHWKKFLFAKDRITFKEQFEQANTLALPECRQFAEVALQRYGVMDEELRNAVTLAALARKDYATYRPVSGGEVVADTLVAVSCGDFETAKKLAPNPLLQRFVAMSKALETGDKATVDRLLNTVTSQMPLNIFEYQALLQMAESSRDTNLYRKLRNLLLAQSKAETLPLNLANSLGFVAVTLNVDLELAAKLLERVYAEEKTAAYTDSIAMLRFRQKRYDEAAKMIREAFAIREPGETASVLLLHAAQIMNAKGEKVLALKLLERAKRSRRPEDFEYDAQVEKELTEALK